MAKEVYDLLEEKGLEYVDATCPFVKRIHNIVEKESRTGEEDESLLGIRAILRWKGLKDGQ